MLDIASPLGGDVEKIGHFQKKKNTFTWKHFFASLLGGDVETQTFFDNTMGAM